MQNFLFFTCNMLENTDQKRLNELKMHSFYFAILYFAKFILNQTKYYCLLKYKDK